MPIYYDDRYMLCKGNHVLSELERCVCTLCGSPIDTNSKECI